MLEHAAEHTSQWAALEREIQRVWDANVQVYSAKKVWKQWQREWIALSVGSRGDAYDNAPAALNEPSLRKSRGGSVRNDALGVEGVDAAGIHPDVSGAV